MLAQCDALVECLVSCWHFLLDCGLLYYLERQSLVEFCVSDELEWLMAYSTILFIIIFFQPTDILFVYYDYSFHCPFILFILFYTLDVICLCLYMPLYSRNFSLSLLLLVFIIFCVNLSCYWMVLMDVLISFSSW